MDINKIELPVPTQEKVLRWATWAGIGGIAVCGGIAFFPALTQFFTLLQGLLSSAIGAFWAFVGLMFSIFIVMKSLSIVKQAVDVFAKRAAWALVKISPTIHLEIWLDEVLQDVEDFANQLQMIAGLKERTEQRRDAALEKANKAQGLYNQAMNRLQRGGLSSIEQIELETAKTTQSQAAGKWSEAAKRFQKSLDRLTEQELQNTKLYQVFSSEARSLEIDIEIKKNEWEQAVAEGQIADISERLLIKKSRKQAYAEKAEQVISSRYAENIGRLRNLKNLSREAFQTFDLETGAYDEDAYKKWQEQSARMIGGNSTSIHNTSVAATQPAKQALF